MDKPMTLLGETCTNNYQKQSWVTTTTTSSELILSRQHYPSLAKTRDNKDVDYESTQLLTKNLKKPHSLWVAGSSCQSFSFQKKTFFEASFSFLKKGSDVSALLGSVVSRCVKTIFMRQSLGGWIFAYMQPSERKECRPITLTLSLQSTAH